MSIKKEKADIIKILDRMDDRINVSGEKGVKPKKANILILSLSIMIFKFINYIT